MYVCSYRVRVFYLAVFTLNRKFFYNEQMQLPGEMEECKRNAFLL